MERVAFMNPIESLKKMVHLMRFEQVQSILSGLLKIGIITAWDSSKKFEDTDMESMIRYSIVEINDEKAIFTWPGKSHKYEFHKIM